MQTTKSANKKAVFYNFNEFGIIYTIIIWKINLQNNDSNNKKSS